jgi:hypothetical protein
MKNSSKLREQDGPCLIMLFCESHEPFHYGILEQMNAKRGMRVLYIWKNLTQTAVELKEHSKQASELELNVLYHE